MHKKWEKLLAKLVDRLLQYVKMTTVNLDPEKLENILEDLHIKTVWKYRSIWTKNNKSAWELLEILKEEVIRSIKDWKSENAWPDKIHIEIKKLLNEENIGSL